MLPARGVFGLLREDAGFCAEVSTLAQGAAIAGVTPAKLTGREALWVGSEEHREREKREKEQRIENFRRQWGYLPPEYPAG